MKYPKEDMAEPLYHRFYLSRSYGNVTIVHARLRVIRRTPCGAWVRESYGEREHWVSDNSGKAYAYADEGKAWHSFQKRMRHRKIYADQESLAVNMTLDKMPDAPPPADFMVYKSPPSRFMEDEAHW